MIDAEELDAIVRGEREANRVHNATARRCRKRTVNAKKIRRRIRRRLKESSDA